MISEQFELILLIGSDQKHEFDTYDKQNHIPRIVSSVSSKH